MTGSLRRVSELTRQMEVPTEAAGAFMAGVPIPKAGRVDTFSAPITTNRDFYSSNRVKLNSKFMQADGIILGRRILRRPFAIVACVALLSFAFAGTLPHQHPQGQNNACHFCQVFHTAALAAARLDLISAPQTVTWHSPLPQLIAQSDSFSLHRASRAPPTA